MRYLFKMKHDLLQQTRDRNADLFVNGFINEDVYFGYELIMAEKEHLFIVFLN